MRLKNIVLGAGLGISALGVLFSCTKEVSSRINFVHKQGGFNKEYIGKVGDTPIMYSDFVKGIESELYEAEKRVYDLKIARIKSLILKMFVDKDPRKANMNEDDFLNKYVLTGIKITDKEVEEFIQKRKIPQEHITPELKERIKKYLSMDKNKNAIDVWLASMAAKTPVELYFPEPVRPVFNIVAGDSPSLGGNNAKVEVVEFSDFQCHYCAQGAEVVHALEKKYGSKIKIVFKNFPLPMHKDGKIAAEAGLCAHDQGKFWKMHDLMFADQSNLSSDKLKEKAKKLKLDEKKFGECLDSHKYASKVDQEVNYGQSVGVGSTPTFFVNGILVTGAQGPEVFSELIDQELAK